MSFDTQALREQMPALVSNYLPSRARTFKYITYDDKPKTSALGFHIDPKPFEGKVVAETEDVIVIQKGRRAEFAVLDRTLVTAEPATGAKVRIEPYARRRFDGLRADTPKEETFMGSDGKPHVMQSYILGSAPAKLPIPEPRCLELQQLIEQLETLRAPDGFRHITHMLVDAGARDFTWVDPLPKDIIETPPAISFTVGTEKFQGRVTILYERSSDTYAIELYCGDERVDRVDDVYFDTRRRGRLAIFLGVQGLVFVIDHDVVFFRVENGDQRGGIR